VVVPDPDMPDASGNTGLGDTRSVFWAARCFSRPIVKAPPKTKTKTCSLCPRCEIEGAQVGLGFGVRGGFGPGVAVPCVLLRAYHVCTCRKVQWCIWVQSITALQCRFGEVASSSLPFSSLWVQEDRSRYASNYEDSFKKNQNKTLNQE
jgi:hypothetical protein